MKLTEQEKSDLLLAGELGREGYAQGYQAPAQHPEFIRLLEQSTLSASPLLDAYLVEWHRAHKRVSDERVADLGVLS